MSLETKNLNVQIYDVWFEALKIVKYEFGIEMRDSGCRLG